MSLGQARDVVEARGVGVGAAEGFGRRGWRINFVHAAIQAFAAKCWNNDLCLGTSQIDARAAS
jgi:hypothetical protein